MENKQLGEQEEEIRLIEKPCYISELEKEILTLTPDEALKAAAFVSALKAERTHEL